MTVQEILDKAVAGERIDRGEIERLFAEGSLLELGQAADVIASHPVALQLRTLQTMAEIATEKNSTILFPLPIDLLTPFMNKTSKGD